MDHSKLDAGWTCPPRVRESVGDLRAARALYCWWLTRGGAADGLLCAVVNARDRKVLGRLGSDLRSMTGW